MCDFRDLFTFSTRVNMWFTFFGFASAAIEWQTVDPNGPERSLNFIFFHLRIQHLKISMLSARTGASIHFTVSVYPVVRTERNAPEVVQVGQT